MGNTCSSIGARPSNSSPVNRGAPTDDDEERKVPPASDADAQLAIVLQNREISQAAGADLVCLHASSSPQQQQGPERASHPAVRDLLSDQVRILGGRLLQFLPYRDASVLATVARSYRACTWGQPTRLHAQASYNSLIKPLAGLKLLDEADNELRGFVRQEHELLERSALLMERYGWSVLNVLNHISDMSLARYAAYMQIDGLFAKAANGTITNSEQHFLQVALPEFEVSEFIQEAIEEASNGNRDPLRELERRTLINFCIREIHDLADRSKRLKAEEDKLELLPAHSITSIKAKLAHIKTRDAIHHLSVTKRDALAELSAQLTALRASDPRHPDLLSHILYARQDSDARGAELNGKIQTRKLLAMGFEHELNEHLVETDRWIRSARSGSIDPSCNAERVHSAWIKAGLPISALQTMSEAIMSAPQDNAAALLTQLKALRQGLLEKARSSLIEHFTAESNPTVSFSQSPPPALSTAANSFTFAYVDPVTGRGYPPQTYAHVGEEPFAKKFFVTNDRGEIVHVRTHVFNAPSAQGRQQTSSGVREAQVVMHLEETKGHGPTGH